jgi:hypothetical protein
MFHRFQYESEFYPSLSRIPLEVRMKLDLAGVKISLKDWLAWSFEERTVLCHLPCAGGEELDALIAYLDFLSRKYAGAPAAMTERLDPALWEGAEVPSPVREKSAECGRVVTRSDWLGWQSYQRYALYKTAISKSQPEAFANVLEELRAANKTGPAER